jgi:penicillin-binding protein 1A
MGSDIQIISPQNAYIMTRLLDKVVTVGTLASGTGFGAKLNVKDDKGVSYRIPAGGKTGTTQNWSDGWAVGFTPYYTIAIWFGFDKPGNSLGMNVSGASLAGPIWGNLMQNNNQGLPRRDFVRPAGVTEATVCRSSGLRMTSSCPAGITLSFLAGTVPSEVCDQHGPNAIRTTRGVLDMPATFFLDADLTGNLQMPTLPQELMQGFPAFETESRGDAGFDRENRPFPERGNAVNEPDTGLELPSYDPLID